MTSVYIVEFFRSVIIHSEFPSPEVIEPLYAVCMIQNINSLKMQYINKYNLNVRQMDNATNNNSDKIRWKGGWFLTEVNIKKILYTIKYKNEGENSKRVYFMLHVY